MASRFLEHEPNPARKPCPFGFLVHEPLLAGPGQAIEARPAIVLRRAPFGGDPALFFKSLKSGVERTLLDLEDFVGELADPLRNRPAVERLERDGLQDQQVNGALNEI